VKIREARKTDYEALMTLYNGFVGEDRYSRHDNDSFHTVLENSNNYIYPAEDGGELIGFAAFSVRDVVRYPQPIAEVDEIFVSVWNQKKAVGRKLMEKMEGRARELNCYRIFIEFAFEHEGVHIFYEALGYTKYGYHFIKNL